ncbi:hypothetical protein H6G11_03500 [Cyanobacterium aponinum FACHB-4101]|uniref:hypothetical protein n=1 Tax=Cyanobacterium aponinum TaxID=379064 RepID=UPI00168033F6|nr:hypothetical protein [Cyanobacterium aponinum]MBD2393317.1 hypothetical protein [Cyanobacterium aponinum FACHB-4101]
MTHNNHCTSACRYCRFYSPEGRRGGMCSQLGVSVKAHWKSCHFASPVFDHNWQPLPDIALLEKSFSLGCATPQVNFTIESNKVTESHVNSTEEIVSN